MAASSLIFPSGVRPRSRRAGKPAPAGFDRDEQRRRTTATIAFMATSRPTPVPYVQPYRYPSPHIPLSAIRRFARQIAERFQPEKIILFGSYAYGTPHNESDVDLLVIMPAYDVVNQSIRICNAFDVWPFSLDLIVRTPRQIERGLKQNNWFLREITEKGKVLYDARNGAVGAIRRRGLASGKRTCRENSSSTKRSLLPLPAIGRKVPQSSGAGNRPRRAKNTQP